MKEKQTKANLIKQQPSNLQKPPYLPQVTPVKSPISSTSKKLVLAVCILVQTFLIQVTTSLSQIKSIVTPTVDFSYKHIGTLSFETVIQMDFDYSTTTLKDLTMRVVFPFALTNPVEVQWIQVIDTCIITSNMKSTTTTISSIVGETAGRFHFFTMTDANYIKNTSFKLIFKITQTSSIPTTKGFTDPVTLAAVSSTSANFMTYALNTNLAKFYIGDPASSDFEFDLTPSYSDINIGQFTRTFFGQADTRIYSGEISRILIKLSNYVFSDDAESTCSTVPDADRNILALDRNDFYCEFEASDKKGLYFIWKEDLFAPNQITFRMRFRIKNSNLPGTSDVQVAMMERHSPLILKHKTILNAFLCGPADFGINSPKMFVGPNLDTSSSFFPNVTLYTMMNSHNAVVFNSLRFTVRLSLDLPVPRDHYRIVVKIGGIAATVLPKSFIYHDFPVANGKSNVEIIINGATRDIELRNVGPLSSRTTYNFGFKVAFSGAESLVFLGTNAIGAMEIFDFYSGVTTTVIKRAPPSGVKSSFQQLRTNLWPTVTTQNWPTMLHTRLNNENVDANYVVSGSSEISHLNPDTNPKYGMEKGSDLQFILKISQISALAPAAFVPVNTQSFIEIITHNSIFPSSTIDWSLTPHTNCGFRSNTGVLLINRIASCFAEKKNEGLFGSEYSRFRMSPLNDPTNNFWPAAGINNHYIWRGITVTKQTSIAFDDTDAAILDAYINIYSDTFTKDITINFVQGLAFTYLDNMIVKNFTQFPSGSTSIQFMNYIRHSAPAGQLDGSMIPGFLRVGGTFPNIDTFNSNKLVIFYTDFEPLFLDNAVKYEIGCSTSSTATVKCYHHEGVASTFCNPAAPAVPCFNQMMKSRIEILFSTTIISISNFYQVQVLIPIKQVTIPVAYTPIYIALGTAKGHFSTLSAYPQMLSFARYTINPPIIANSYTSQVTQLLSPAQTITDLTQGLGFKFGKTTGSDKIKYRCNVEDAYCAGATQADFIGLTMCAEWDFMELSTYRVKNGGGEAYENCAYRIKYMFAGVMKYCFFCPVFQTTLAAGPALREIDYENFKMSGGFGLRWPPKTFFGVSGKRNSHGLRAITELVNLPTTYYTFTPGKIENLLAVPAIIPHNHAGAASAKNLKLVIKFTTQNELKVGFWIVFSSSTGPFPFSFKHNPLTSTFCTISTGSIKSGCTVNKVSSSNFDIQVPVLLPAGNIEVSFNGVFSLSNTGAELNINTYVAGGKTLGFSVDASTAALAINPNVVTSQFTFIDIDSGSPSQTTEVLKMRNLRLTETNQGYRTELMVDFHLPAYKDFHVSDLLFVNLGAGGFNTLSTTPAKRVYCEIMQLGTLKIIPGFSNCNVNDLNNILITAKEDTFTNAFTLRLTSYETPLVATVPDATARLRFVTDPTYITGVTTGFPLWVNKPTIVNLASFTIEKFINYIGHRSQFRITFRTTGVALAYESRVYLDFPIEFDPQLGSNPVTCYLNQLVPVSLYCTIIGERRLEITGFNPTFAAGASVVIDIYGIEQPVEVGNEVYFLGVDANDLRTVVDESGQASTGSASVPVGILINHLQILSTSYSHSYIRAKNNIIIQIKSPITIPGAHVFYVYVDYLLFEYQSYGVAGNCVIQETETSPSKSLNCERQGNRFKIIVKATESLTAGVKYSILINNVPTPDFTICNTKNIDIYVVDNSIPEVLVLITSDFFQNSALQTFRKDEKLVYLDFVNLDKYTPISVRKGVFNKIEIKREDDKRFNDDFTYTLTTTENGIFGQLPTSQIETYDSIFGLKTYPIFLSSTINTFTNQISLTVSNTARFQKQLFSVFPILRVKLSNDKTFLKVPEIVVFGNLGSHDYWIDADLLPLDPITFAISFTGCLDCSVVPTTAIISQTQRRFKIRISKVADVVPVPPATFLTAQIVFTPTLPLLRGYDTTVANFIIRPQSANGVLATTFIPLPLPGAIVINNATFVQSEPSAYGLKLDIVDGQTLSYYAVTMPSGIFRPFTRNQIMLKYEESKVTDEFYFINYFVSDKPSNLNVEVIKNKLRANTKYKTLIYYSRIQAPTNIYSHTFEFLTQDTAGGDGYLNITFASSIAEDKKSDVVCQIAQILNYPLEKQEIKNLIFKANLNSIQTSEGHRCPSVLFTYPTATVEMPATSRLLEEVPTSFADSPEIEQKSMIQENKNQHDDRNLEVLIVSPNGNVTPREALNALLNSNTKSQGVNLQIIFLKNLKEYHSTTLYSETQSSTLANDFSSKLGNYLKNHPLILGYSPLISFQHQTPSLYNDTRIYNLLGNTTVQVTELTSNTKGYLYAMILFKQDSALEEKITPMHVKLGINLSNSPALTKMKFIVDDLRTMGVPSTIKHFTPGSKIWMNLKGLPWDAELLKPVESSAASVRRNLGSAESKKISWLEKACWLVKELLGLGETNSEEEWKYERVLQTTNTTVNDSKFNDTIFWNNTIPNLNVTNYTLFYIATD